jgi:HK97 family phage major capsid protein
VIDETSRATGSRSGGVQVYWAAEADTATAKKPKLRQMKLEKKKLLGFAYLTDELAEDGPAAQSLIVDAFTKEFGFTIANAMFRGSGVGQPLGFMNAPRVVSQAIEGSQTIANSSTYLSLNIPKMLARVPSSLWNDVIFLYNQELLPYLINTVTSTSGTVPLFLTAGGLTGKPFDTIMGRPAYASELCEAVGTVGRHHGDRPERVPHDRLRQAGVAESIHVRFLYGENTLRFTTRAMAPRSGYSAVTRFKGSVTQSPFVTLAVRS